MAYIYEELSTGAITSHLYADKDNNGFPYEGCQALAQHITDMVQDIGEPYELDIVALRCEWTEYADIAAVIENYADVEDLQALQDTTEVIAIAGTSRLLVLEF